MSTRGISYRHGVWAAVAAVAVAGAVGASAVAGAEERRGTAAADVTIQAQDTAWSDLDVTIQTGDTVTWTFAGTNLPHNVASDEEPGESPDPAWDTFVEPGQFQDAPDDAAYDFTFTQPGDYVFVCEFHEGPMTGTIHVEGEPVPTPTPDPEPTPDPDPTPDPEPTPPPQPGGPGGGGGGGGGSTAPHVNAPPPSIAASADTTRPAISRVSGKGLRNRRVRVRFSLTETATVSVTFRRAGRKGVLRTARVMGHQGRNTITVRSRAFKKGRRYTVHLRARDAVGNRSATARKTFRKRR
jgi:plastocyanin